MNRSRHYTPADNRPAAKILETLAGDRAIRRVEVRQEHLTLLDTFDWRLHRKGFALALRPGKLQLESLDRGTPLSSIPWQKSSPRFWNDLPDSDLQGRLRSILGARALLHLVDLRRQIQGIHLLNEDRKTVLRILAETDHAGSVTTETDPPPIITLQEVRGYGDTFDRLTALVETMPLQPAEGDSYHRALKAAGKIPGDYSSKVTLALDPSAPASKAVADILAALLNVMRCNVDGICNDVDIEFLHDFRVAVRRIRSLIGQMKQVFPTDVTRRLRTDFAAIGARTNRLRDLDVYLGLEGKYRRLLPESLQDGLHPLFTQLESERRKEHAALRRYLGQAEFSNTMGLWQAFCAHPSDWGTSSKHSATPILKRARKVTARRFSDVVAIGSAIDNASPDADLHRLRIQCKKLRYLMEFFASLFPETDVRSLIDGLKDLQDNLGDFNDLSVQQAELLGDLEAGQPDPVTTAALGGLLTALDHSKRRKRADFRATFSRFTQPHNRDLFRALYGSSGS